MKHPFFASLLALFLCAPAAQARDNGIAPIGFGSATWLAHPHGMSVAGLRISDSSATLTGRIGLPAFMIDERNANRAGNLPQASAVTNPAAYARGEHGAAVLQRPLTLRLAQGGARAMAEALASLNAQAGSLRACASRDLGGAIDATPQHLE